MKSQKSSVHIAEATDRTSSQNVLKDGEAARKSAGKVASS